uniref:Unannotated protein n=1 Tax=freshwater metagenome TaxID=449393 RepID=A0A6J5Z2P5_9ZZZZ
MCQAEVKAAAAVKYPEIARSARRVRYEKAGGYKGKIERLTSLDKGKIAFREAVAKGPVSRAYWLLDIPPSQLPVVEKLVRSPRGETDLDSLLALFSALPTRQDRGKRLRWVVLHLRKRFAGTGYTIHSLGYGKGYRLGPIEAAP